MKTMADTMIETGGLMRCCTATIAAYVEKHLTEPAVDMELDCQHEPRDNKQIILVGGTWKWAGIRRER